MRDEASDTADGADISVCLLTYNHANVIESTLRSIMDQSVQRHEIVVSDDCSTDGTWEVVLALAAQDPRIRAVRTPRNLGMAGNANFAVAQSNRPYIALLHHDDLYRPQLLERWRWIMSRHPDVGFVFNPYAVHGSDRIDGHSFSTGRLEGRWFLHNFLLPSWGCPVRGTAMIAREWWTRMEGMCPRFGLLADIDLWMRLAAATAVGYVAEPLIVMRHARPDYYPEIYRGNAQFWQRQRLLYEIHAENRLSVLAIDSVRGRLQWWWFRLRLSAETAKWLAYALVRRRQEMLAGSAASASPYDIPPLRWLRCALCAFVARRPRSA